MNAAESSGLSDTEMQKALNASVELEDVCKSRSARERCNIIKTETGFIDLNALQIKKEKIEEYNIHYFSPE